MTSIQYCALKAGIVAIYRNPDIHYKEKFTLSIYELIDRIDDELPITAHAVSFDEYVAVTQAAMSMHLHPGLDDIQMTNYEITLYQLLQDLHKLF